MISPYSILRTSGTNDVDETLNSLTASCGPKSNRSQILRQLALKQKIQNNPFLQKQRNFSKQEAERKGKDPHANVNNYNHQQINKNIFPKGVMPHQLAELNVDRQKFERTQHIARMRNKRGQY